MKLQELAVEPQLIKVSLDEEKIIEQYGEPLEFYVWDRQPIENFMKFAGKKIDDKNIGDIVAFAKDMILDEAGNPVLTGKSILPLNVMTTCITKVMETLGK